MIGGKQGPTTAITPVANSITDVVRADTTVQSCVKYTALQCFKHRVPVFFT
jgi:hypothetical protein